MKTYKANYDDVYAIQFKQENLQEFYDFAIANNMWITADKYSVTLKKETVVYATVQYNDYLVVQKDSLSMTAMSESIFKNLYKEGSSNGLWLLVIKQDGKDDIYQIYNDYDIAFGEGYECYIKAIESQGVKQNHFNNQNITTDTVVCEWDTDSDDDNIVVATIKNIWTKQPNWTLKIKRFIL